MVITLKWIYKVRLDELGGIFKNKARFVAHGYCQEEGINFKESLATVARLEAIWIFLAFAAHMNMIVYQMEVNMTFLNESLKKYGMESCDLVDTSIVEKSKLDKDTEGKVIDPTHYRGMVGTLMYLTSSRPDLDYTIALISVADAGHSGCQDTRQQVENGVVELYFARTEYQLADIFTKALCRERIKFLIDKMGMKSFTPETLKELADEAEE
nr:integrase, catalytic region, zinc finger, CCHC-type, peptidase aspartic, catalytic [Tanacetum cinerariifolium]